MTAPARGLRTEAPGHITLNGVRQHNLKDISLRVPKGRITVFTGVSGSGKSSLVFDTIAAESQRQLNETFPWFIRNRLTKHESPQAEAIADLSPAIVVDQRPIGGNARSTVGTMSEIHPLLRVLFSRHGTPSAGSSTAYSFNDPRGMCTECDGLGRTVRPDLARLLDERRSLNEGAINFAPFRVGTVAWQLYAESGLFDPDTPLADFTERERELLLHGSGFTVHRRGSTGAVRNTYEGIVARINRLYLKDGLDALRERDRAAVEKIVSKGACTLCHGARLNPAALASTIAGRNIADYCAMEISDLIRELEGVDDPTVAPVVTAALAALRRVESVGLGYLTLDRETATLSGGEGQRLKIVRHLGSSLTGMTYILDEPSAGLHPRDVHRLNDLLRALRDKGSDDSDSTRNTILVVEHDRDVIAIADHVVDMGPDAGRHGGEVVFEGTVAALRDSDTRTGRALRRVTGPKAAPRRPTGSLTITQASRHNLKDVTVAVPTGVLTAVTGVAGSGKSTLVTDALPAEHAGTVIIDQSTIGVSPRSTPATYLNLMDTIRTMFARANGVSAGLFSFNSEGACPGCDGRGVIRTDLAFMEPVTTTCEMCDGRRFAEKVLSYTLDGRTVVDVLGMTVEQALACLPSDVPRRGLEALDEVGLGFLTLGQPLSSLSGGERQRLKLAHRLRDTGSVHVYVFDEPTTGLHMADVDDLLALLDRLVDAGNTVVVAEHDADMITHADWVIDLGPGAGKHGGRVVFEGTPAQLAGADSSHTAAYLRDDWARNPLVTVSTNRQGSAV